MIEPLTHLFTPQRARTVFVSGLFVLLGGCGGGDETAAAVDPQEQARRQLIADGQNVYYTLCIACHHVDPALAGPQGPPVKGASAELLHAKIVLGSYPEGYQPLQDTQLMPVLDVLEPQVPALTAFLNQ